MYTELNCKEIRYYYELPKYNYYYEKFKKNKELQKHLEYINSCFKKFIMIRDLHIHSIQDSEDNEIDSLDYLINLSQDIKKELEHIKTKDKELYLYILKEYYLRVLGIRDNTEITMFWINLFYKFCEYTTTKKENIQFIIKYFEEYKKTDPLNLITLNNNLIVEIKENIKNLINIQKLSVTEILQTFNNCNNFEQCLYLLNFYYENNIYTLINCLDFENYIKNLGYLNLVTNFSREYLYKCIKSCQKEQENKLTEKIIKDYIISNFNKIFPNYTFIGTEIPIKNIGRIDILALDNISKRDVIIEIKKGTENPNKQLLAYSHNFDNYILVGITNMKKELYLDEIKYYTLKDIGFVKELGSK